MANALRKTRIVAFILALIEIGLFATGIALYLYDIPSGIQAAIKPQFWAFGAGVVAFANIVAVAIIIAHISRIRQKSDLRAADVIGGDVQEAYNFGQIGLVVTDNDDRVIWNNLLFKERSIELLDQNIEEWQPKLRELKDGNNNMTVMIEVDSHTYEVKYLSEAHLYIFKDTTDLEQVTSYNMEQAICIGIIMIMFVGTRKAKNAGTICMGFGILFMGMGLMSDNFGFLKSNQVFLDMVSTMSSPVLGLLVGMVFTGIIQSSSASVAEELWITAVTSTPTSIAITLLLVIFCSMVLSLLPAASSRPSPIIFIPMRNRPRPPNTLIMLKTIPVSILFHPICT